MRWLVFALLGCSTQQLMANEPTVVDQDDALAQAQREFAGGPVRLLENGTLHAGPHARDIQLESASEFWRERQLALAVVEIAEGVEGVLLTQPVNEQEDPPNRYQLFWLRNGALTLAFDRVVGTYGAQTLEIPGDGTLRYKEDSWAGCERTGAAEANLEVVTFRPQGDTFVEAEREPSGDVFQCDQLAACPFVYVEQDGEFTRVGEILRNIRDTPAVQSLGLGLVSTGRLVVELREEKDEVTYLRRVHLQVAGQRIDCAECGDARLLRGGVRRLVFEVPVAGEAELVAEGYYVPTTRPALTRTALQESQTR